MNWLSPLSNLKVFSPGVVMNPLLKRLMLFTDIGFILYWTITLGHAIPDALLFKDYANPILSAWNWSFLPLDLFISITGLAGIYLKQREHELWKSVILCSLVLTFCSGLQAISFWILRGDYDWVWWAPNLFLLLYPPCFIPQLLTSKKAT